MKLRMKLSCLITRLEHHVSPMELFSMYHGTDWMPYVKYQSGSFPYSLPLLTRPSIELVLYGWNPGQSLTLSTTTAATVYAKILTGHCATSILYPNHTHLVHKTLWPRRMTTIPPFSTYTFETAERTASLHLILRV